MSDIIIDKMKKEDWSQVSKIFMQGIETKNATFEKDCPDWENWNQKYLKECRIVAKLNENVIGWAALAMSSNRLVYKGVCEVSVYVDLDFQRIGVGQLLMKNLIIISEKNNIWTLQAGIFPENVASIELHKKNRFKILGIREKIGKMDARWRDVVLLERRSKKVGTE